MDPNKADPTKTNPVTPENPVVPEVKEEKQPEYSYDEVHKEPIKEIATNEEVPEVKPEPTPEEKAIADAKAKEEADAKVAAEAKAKEEEEAAVAPEELAEDISKRIAEKLAPEEKKEVKDKYTQFFEKVKAEKGREPNWIEVSQFLEEQAVLRVEQKQKEAQEAKVKADEEKAKQDEVFVKKFNTNIDEELEELYKEGKLTPIKDAKNPDDPGVKERKALFQAMYDTNLKRVQAGQDPITSVSRIFYGGYYTKPTPAQPAGENAPVSLGSGTPGSGEGEQEVDYVKDVKKPWSFFQKKPQ